MPLSHVEILVEEASMETLLRILLPKIIGPVHYSFQRFQGKRALLRKLSGRLRGLRRMIQSDWLILVVVDRDRDDCLMLKALLESEARAAGLATRSSTRSGQFAVINRIAGGVVFWRLDSGRDRLSASLDKHTQSRRLPRPGRHRGWNTGGL